MVDQADLDARPINALPAVGVALSAVLTIVAVRGGGVRRLGRRSGDAARAGAAVALLVLSLPWLLADLGVYVGDVPLLGRGFLSKEVPPGETLPAVHLGHHHGLDGVLLALTAVLLTRCLGVVAHDAIRRALAWYLPVLLVYGLANAAQDFWLEQVVKRGWAPDAFPSLLCPTLSPAWAAMLLAAVILHALLIARPADGARSVALDGPAG